MSDEGVKTGGVTDEDEERHGRAVSRMPALAGDGTRPYLGNPEVVRGLLDQIVQAALEDPDQVEAAVEAATSALCGEDPDYQAMGPWNSEGVGNWIRGSMRGVPDGGAREAVQYALGHLALHALESVKDPDHAAAGARLNYLLKNWTELMLGVSSN